MPKLFKVIGNRAIAYDFTLAGFAFYSENYSGVAFRRLSFGNVAPPQCSRLADTNAAVRQDQNILLQIKSLALSSPVTHLLNVFGKIGAKDFPLGLRNIMTRILPRRWKPDGLKVRPIAF